MLVVAGLLALTATATATAASGRLALQRLVVAEARNMGVAPGLALAVAHAESDFNPKVRSHKGARGIMQIMPRTAWEEYGIVPEQLWQPRINVRLGLHSSNVCCADTMAVSIWHCPITMAAQRWGICHGPGLYQRLIPMCARSGNFG